VLLLLLPPSNLESKIKSMIKSKRQGIPSNSMAVHRILPSPAWGQNLMEKAVAQAFIRTNNE
jgi:hypothetical protein